MVSAVSERPRIQERSLDRASYKPLSSSANVQSQPNVEPSGAVETTTHGSGPTSVSAAEARTRMRADPIALQLRVRAENSLATLPLKQQTPPDTAPSTGFPADGSVDDAEAYLAENPPVGEDPSTWTEDQLRAFNVLGQDFGDRHVEHHEAWHRTNGAGGTRGPGSGELFLQFHRDMMADFEAETGVPAPTGWDPSEPVPGEITDPDGPRTTSDPNVFLPSWLSPTGEGTEEGDAQFGETVTVDGQTFSSLEDFENPDQLGRAMGESGYHASVHSNLGGTMGGFASPRDAAFYLWHGHIDGLVDQWLETENGQAWAAANPDSPLLNPGTTEDHTGH
jgi:hypothetical protein